MPEEFKLEKPIKGIACYIFTEQYEVDDIKKCCFELVEKKKYQKNDDIFDYENTGILVFVGIDSIILIKPDMYIKINIDIEHFFNTERGYINKIRKLNDSYKISITTPSSEILKEKWDKDKYGFISAIGQDVVPGMTARYLDITEPVSLFVNSTKEQIIERKYK